MILSRTIPVRRCVWLIRSFSFRPLMSSWSCGPSSACPVKQGYPVWLENCTLFTGSTSIPSVWSGKTALLFPTYLCVSSTAFRRSARKMLWWRSWPNRSRKSNMGLVTCIVEAVCTFAWHFKKETHREKSMSTSLHVSVIECKYCAAWSCEMAFPRLESVESHPCTTLDCIDKTLAFESSMLQGPFKLCYHSSWSGLHCCL